MGLRNKRKIRRMLRYPNLNSFSSFFSYSNRRERRRQNLGGDALVAIALARGWINEDGTLIDSEAEKPEGIASA